MAHRQEEWPIMFLSKQILDREFPKLEACNSWEGSKEWSLKSFLCNSRWLQGLTSLCKITWSTTLICSMKLKIPVSLTYLPRVHMLVCITLRSSLQVSIPSKFKCILQWSSSSLQLIKSSSLASFLRLKWCREFPVSLIECQTSCNNQPKSIRCSKVDTSHQLMIECPTKWDRWCKDSRSKTSCSSKVILRTMASLVISLSKCIKSTEGCHM